MKGNKKRLFVFCDGTWQDGVNNNKPLTNVATLARCLERYDEKRLQQIAYYDSGVGNATSLPAQLIDAATGRGEDDTPSVYEAMKSLTNWSSGHQQVYQPRFAMHTASSHTTTTSMCSTR